MKKINILNIVLLLSVLGISSCVVDDFATLNSAAKVTPSASETDVVLTKEGEGTDVLEVSWPQPSFGFSADSD